MTKPNTFFYALIIVSSILNLQPRSVENSRNSRSMENLDRPVVASNHSSSSSSQNRRTSTESGPNQVNPDQKPVKKRSVDESSRNRKKPSDSPSSSSGPKPRSSENRRSRTESQEPTPPSAARSSAVLQSSINPLLTDVRI